MALSIGVIADDLTGATDIAGFLVASGLPTVQFNGFDDVSESDIASASAVVIGLKTRSIAPEAAIEQSLAALEVLERLGAERIVFKYCSTFDSTAKGNIGPVTDALLDAMGEDFTVVVPALPVNGRTVYQGHLFVFDQLLSESGMRHHPVTPMQDSHLVRLMEAQSSGRAVSIPLDVVQHGVAALHAALDDARESGARYAVIDAIAMDHLDIIGAAVADMRLTTGGSGLGSGVAASVTRARGRHDAGSGDGWSFDDAARTVILSGSSSEMTNAQVDQYRAIAPHAALDIDRVLHDADAYRQALVEWTFEHLDAGPAPLIFATAAPEAVAVAQRAHGGERVSAAIEGFFGALARALHDRGVNRFIVAGGETSGAVTHALGVRGFRIGPQIAPGVPWTRGLGSPVELALKSGNFGDADFFAAAQRAASNR